MIVFDGYISGNAEKHLWRKSRVLGQKIVIITFLLLLPFFIYVAVSQRSWWVMLFYGLIFLYIFLLTFIPKSKKEKLALTPKKIYTEGKYIISVSARQEEYRCIKDAKKVFDFGEFYEIVFPVGKVSGNFICQKKLLKAGTLKEFEKLFAGKIIRKFENRTS